MRGFSYSLLYIIQRQKERERGVGARRRGENRRHSKRWAENILFSCLWSLCNALMVRNVFIFVNSVHAVVGWLWENVFRFRLVQWVFRLFSVRNGVIKWFLVDSHNVPHATFCWWRLVKFMRDFLFALWWKTA